MVARRTQPPLTSSGDDTSGGAGDKGITPHRKPKDKRQARERALQLIQKYAGYHAREATSTEWIVRLVSKVDSHCRKEVQDVLVEEDALVQELKRLQEEVVGPVQIAVDNITVLETKMQEAEANARLFQEKKNQAERVAEAATSKLADLEATAAAAVAETQRLESYLQQTKQDSFHAKVAQANRARDLREGMQRAKTKLREQNSQLQAHRFNMGKLAKAREEEQLGTKALKNKISTMAKDFNRQKQALEDRIRDLEINLNEVHSYRHHVPLSSRGLRK